jgi:PAS domain S-box-containing protein
MKDEKSARPEPSSASGELGRSATVLRALVETTSDPVLVLDLDGAVRSWNSACEALFGWSAAEAIGSVLPFVPESRHHAAVKNIRRDAAVGRVVEREVSGRRKDGSSVGTRSTVVPLSDADGLPWGILQLMRTVESDTRVERLQEEFVSLVSQELKNPLTAILGFAQLLGRPEILEDPMKRRATLRALEARGRQMSSLVDDLLLASRVQEGGLQLEREPVDLVRLVTEAVTRFEQLQTGRSFVIDVDTRMPPAEVDPRRVEQALDNLLSNALKHAPEGDRVLIGVVQEGEDAVVSVTDSGPGIPAEAADRVFDRFFTASVGGAASRGAGLGLFLVRMIAEAHGGSVEVESEPGRGSTFTLRLPLAVS